MLKRKWPLAAFTITALIIALFAAMFITVQSPSFGIDMYPSGPGSIVERGDDTAFNGLFSEPYYSDSLRYYYYKKLEDSFTRAKAARDYDNRSAAYSGFSFRNMGVQKNQWYKYIWIKQRVDSQFTYYFSLAGYVLKEDVYFFVQNRSYNLAWINWDSVRHDSVRMGHYISRTIPVRYSAADKKLLVPLSKKKYNVLSPVMMIIWTLNSAFMIFCIIGLPLQIIVNIARGRPFAKNNMVYLRLMSIALAIVLFVGVAAPYIITLFLADLIPPEFTRESFPMVLLNNIHYFLGAAALFIIGKAFERGYKLQKEQDLTI